MSADPAAAAPSGVVTFLFTDVEGSTRRWEADAQAMRSALVVHDKVLRTAIEAYDGFLFSHTGDGFVAAFASPLSAVNAAIDAQRELQLPVRMGLATGEAELRDGDYFGTVLNRAARVMAAGHGGQILLADSTAGLLSGVDLLDLGPRRLRDLPTPVEVFQVNASGLPDDFPPLRTLDPNPDASGPNTVSSSSNNIVGLLPSLPSSTLRYKQAGVRSPVRTGQGTSSLVTVRARVLPLPGSGETNSSRGVAFQQSMSQAWATHNA